MSKEFFLVAKECPVIATIASLWDNLDQCVTDRSGIERLVIEFYQTLYLVPDSSELHIEAKNAILAQVLGLFPTNFQSKF